MSSLSAVKTLLENSSKIDAKVYCDLLDVLPAGLACKLRISPDTSLAQKLAHLLVVSKIEAGEEQLDFPYKCLSVEGSDIINYSLDHDAIVENTSTGSVIIVDCTSNPGLIGAKRQVLKDQIRGLSKIQDVLVHVFIKKKFEINIKHPEDVNCSNSNIFNLFDTIAKKPKLFRNKFFAACENIYDKVSLEGLQLERPELDERYASWNTPEEVVNDAIRLAQEHNVTDAAYFEKVSKAAGVLTYYDTFVKILEQQRPLNQPFLVMPAELNKSQALSGVLEELKENVIARALLHASQNVGEWVGVTESGIVTHAIMKPTTKTTLLPADSKFLVCAKCKEGHIFQILFSESVIDDNFLQQIMKSKQSEKRKDFYSRTVQEAYKEIMKDYGRYHEELNRDSANYIKNSILGKISSLATVYGADLIRTSGAVCGTITELVDRIRNHTIGDLIDHSYEVAKTFAASLKLSPRENHYYVGVNGPFKSITIIKMTGTQDSFNVASYFCIYKTPNVSNLFCVKNHKIIKEDFCQTKTRTLNKNTLSHALRFPFAYISLLSWEIENNSDEHSNMIGHDFRRLIVNSVLHISVNSDQFSQCAEQLRYLFTSNVGYGASAAAICDKIDFIRTSTTWELLYLFRMLKMACAINVVFKNKKISKLLVDGKWGVALPNSVNPICSFSHLVSSMYYANIYNKFRAFHEVSEAICYNELESENIIYATCQRANRSFVQGISNESFNHIMFEASFDQIKFVNEEVEFCKQLVASGPGRFKLSICFIIGATQRHVKTDKATISEVYKTLAVSPIDACTMRGAMESGIVTKKHQGIRSASALLEELVAQTGFDPVVINREVIMSRALTEGLKDRSFDFSIYSAAARQYRGGSTYRYRVVQKDQKGHREISVLNSKFRLGALFCEKTAQVFSKLVPTDVLDDPSKDIILERKVRECIRGTDNETVISDNSDQKRWGPNHLLHSFSAMFLSLLREDLGLFNIINLILHHGENKYAKFPENLIDLMDKNVVVKNSEPLNEFFTNHKGLFDNGIYEKKFEWGMCQGIFHRTSSLYHGIMCSVVSDVCKNMVNFPKHATYSFVTSDDAERIITIQEKVDDRIAICKKVHSVINNVGCVMNILRNESKSVFSFHITEFNSIFYHNGFLATPTLKQRISKIDVGEGADPILDYLTALSLSMGYFQNGGSYFGTVVIMLMNIVLHTEQWNKWYLLEKNDNIFKRPMEFGGFPCIEPLSVMYCGPISSMFLRSSNKADSRIFAHSLSLSTLIEAANVELDDFSRNEYDIPSEYNMIVYKSAGPTGVFSFSRTDRRLSRFEKRHKLSRWETPDSFITLDKFNPDAKKFIFNLQRITKTCQFEATGGTNSFHIRFTDPWVNIDRKCLRLHNNSFFVKKVLAKRLQIADKISPRELDSILYSIKDEEIKNYYHSISLSNQEGLHRSVIQNRLSILMEDAALIVDVLGRPLMFRYIPSETKNCIAKINLSLHTSVDDDAFFNSLLKSVIGDKIKPALIEQTRDPNVWEAINEIPNMPEKPVIEGIFFSSNIVQIYDKYVRRSTKAICPSNVVPTDISAFMHQIITSRFTEKYGVAMRKFPQLNSSRHTYHAFKACNNELCERSLAFWHDKEKMINFREEEEPVLFGIRSNKDELHLYDNFQVDDDSRIRKTVILETRGKYNFISNVKLWTGARVDIKLSKTTRSLLHRGELTNFHEYCVNKNVYVKNQTKLHYDVRVGGASCLEMQEYDVRKKQYRHYFLYDGGPSYFKVDANLKDPDNAKGWANRLIKFLTTQSRFNARTAYEMKSRHKEQSDIIMFIPMSPLDLYQIRTFPNNLTIFLQHMDSGVLIPVCSQQIGSLDNIDLGLNYTLAHLKEALQVFSKLGEKLAGYEDLDDASRDFIALILFRTSVFTGLTELNEWISKHNYGVNLSSIEAADILRSLILCNTTKKLVGNRVRIHHYFLNLFRNSPHYNNGVTKIKTEAHEIDDKIVEQEMEMELGEETISFRERNILSGAHIKTALKKLQDIEEVDMEGTEDDSGFRIFDGELYRLETEGGDFFPEAGAMSEDEYIEAEARKESDSDEETDRAFVPLTEEIAAVSSSMIVNRPFEECRGMVNEIFAESKRLKPKKSPRRYYASLNNVFDVFKAIASVDFNENRSIEEFMADMYEGESTFFSTKFPFSAACLAEMYFNY